MTSEEEKNLILTGSHVKKKNIMIISKFNLENGKTYVFFNDGRVGEVQEDDKIKIINVNDELKNKIKKIYSDKKEEDKNKKIVSNKLKIKSEDVGYPEL